MQIKFLTSVYNIELQDLEEQNLGSLKQKIRETVPQCKDLANEKILLFYQRAKISGSDSLSLVDVNFTEESVVAVVAVR